MKRYVSDVFDNLSYDTTRVFSHYTVRQPVDAMTKQRVYDSVMRQIEQRNAVAPHSTLRLSKVSVAAAACAAVMVVSAAGVGAAKMYKGFTDYMPAYTEAQKEIVSKAAFSINKQMSGSGVTITATEAMCDGNKFFILLNTEIDPSKISVSDSSTFGSSVELHVTGDPADTQGYSAIYHEVLERSGNTCTELVAFDMGDITDGEQFALSARGLCVQGEKADDVVWAVPDEISIGDGIRFAVTKSSFAKAFDAANGVKFQDYDCSVETGYVSPWYAQFWLHATSDDAAICGKIFNAKQPAFKVVMKDGTVHEGVGVNLGGSAGGADSEGYTAFWDFHCAFKEYVETSDIDYVEINGVKLTLKDVTLEKAATLDNATVMQRVADAG